MNKKVILKIFISALLFYIIFKRVDFGAFIAGLKTMNFAYIPIIVLMFLLNYLFSSIRWKKLILSEKEKDVSVFYLTKLYFVGSFFNNFMPTSIGGDVYKIYKLGEKLKNNAVAFTATFMERFTGMVALIIISYFGLFKTLNFWISQLPSNLSSNEVFIFLFKFILFFGFWAAAIIGFYFVKLFSKKFKFLADIYNSLNSYKNEKNILVMAVVTSFVVQIVAIFSHWFVLKSFGINIDLSYALFIFPVIFLFGFFVPSINGLGVQDALYIKFLTDVGVSSETALVASITYHFFKLCISLIGGVIYASNKID